MKIKRVLLTILAIAAIILLPGVALVGVGLYYLSKEMP